MVAARVRQRHWPASSLRARSHQAARSLRSGRHPCVVRTLIAGSCCDRVVATRPAGAVLASCGRAQCGSEHQRGGDRARALPRRRAQDRRELHWRSRPRATTTASPSTASSPTSRSRAAARGATGPRPQVHAFEDWSTPPGRARLPRDGERRPGHERLPVLHRHRRRVPLARRQAHRVRPDHLGQDVADRISLVERDAGDRPVEPVVIESVELT